MEKAHGRMLVTGAAGGVEVSASILPEPFPKALSQHPQGRKSMVCEPVRAPSLDFIKSNRNRTGRPFCGTWTLAGRAESNQPWQYHRLKCKCWNCATCAPKKSRQVRWGIIAAAEKNKLQRLLTLTLDPRACRPEDSAKHLKETWRKMRVSLQRRCGQSITFILVTEFQKNGYAHLHVLIDRFIPQSWVQQAWQKVGGGRIVDIRHVDIHRVAGYVSKYLTKDMFHSSHYGTNRRYSTSRNIRLFDKQPVKGAWVVIRWGIEAIYRDYKERVTEIQQDENGKLLTFVIHEEPKP